MLSLSTQYIEALCRSEAQTELDDRAFILPETQPQFIEIYLATNWLLWSDLWPQPFGLYREFMIGVDDDDGTIEVCCKHLHNYPFFVYDAWMKFGDYDPFFYTGISEQINKQFGMSWTELLSWYAGHCGSLNLHVDRDYVSARNDFKKIMPAGLDLSEAFEDVVAYRDGGVTA